MNALTFAFNPNEDTPETVAQRRQMADMIMGRMGRAQNVGQGIGDMIAGLAAGFQRYKAGKAAAAGAESANKAWSAFNPFQTAPRGQNPAPTAPNTPSMALRQPADGTSMQGFGNGQTGQMVAQRLQKDFGMTPAAAAGFAGNLAHESGNFKTLQEKSPMVPGSAGGYGWAQWTGPRRRQFEAYASQNGLDPASPEANYGFLQSELRGSESGVLAKLKGVNDPALAAQIVSQNYERPGIPHMQSRINYANQIAQGMGGQQPTQVASNDPQQAYNIAPVAQQQEMQAPPLQMQPQQPQAQQPNNRMAELMQLASNPWLDDSKKQVVQMMLQDEYKKQDPAYQMEMEQGQLGLEKSRLELEQLRNPAPSKPEYITAKDGSVLAATPDGVKVVYGSQPDPVKPTSDIQEYEYARQQGFKGTFPEYQTSIKRAGASQVNIDQKAESAFDKKLAEGQAETFNTMATEGMNARADLSVIDQLDGLMAGQGGMLDGMASKMAAYGIGGPGMSDVQAAQALINKLVPTQRQPGSGSMSDRDVELFTRSLPSLWNTPGGNQKILGVMRGLAQYKQAQGEIAQAVQTGQITRQDAVKALKSLPNPLAEFGKTKQGALPQGADQGGGWSIEEVQ